MKRPKAVVAGGPGGEGAPQRRTPRRPKAVVAGGPGGEGAPQRRTPRRPKAVVAGGPGGEGAPQRRTPRRPKAVVAMSGGVDSSVAAALLAEDGYEVTGIMLKLWRGEAENNRSGCCNLGAAEDARRVADKLGIAFYVMNYADRFERSVIQDFKDAYGAGRTPNPCVRCNQWIKFDALLELASTLGADTLATGHYARVKRSAAGEYRLLRGLDREKDQSYVLWMLGQEQLARCRFPVGEVPHKAVTRSIAAELGLRTASKADSQEICFVRDGDLGTYVTEHVPGAATPGPILDAGGSVVGRHRGIGHYTVGQRRGLGLALGAPVFVRSIDAGTNSLTVGGREELRVGGFVAEETSSTSERGLEEERVLVQHRAHGGVSPATVASSGDRWQVLFDHPVEAVAPGQSAAFYSAEEPDELIGGGIISSTLPVPHKVH